MKISEFLSEHFHFLVVKFSLLLNRLVFIMLRLESCLSGSKSFFLELTPFQKELGVQES